MTGLVERLRQGWRAWKIKRQRSKLRSAYAKVGRIRYGLGPGFSPTLYALDRLTSEGLASITTDGDLIWHWPENDTAGKSGRAVCTDGGQDVTSKWTLVCTDCDWEDELVTDGHPADGPPSEVEDRVRKHKGTIDWSHVVRVEGCRADAERDVDPSLLTDGGQCLGDTVEADATLRLTDEGLEMPEFLKGYVGSFTLRTADITGTFETTDHGMPETKFYDGPIAAYPDDDGDYNPDLGSGYMALATPDHGEEIFAVLDERSQQSDPDHSGGDQDV